MSGKRDKRIRREVREHTQGMPRSQLGPFVQQAVRNVPLDPFHPEGMRENRRVRVVTARTQQGSVKAVEKFAKRLHRGKSR